LNGRKLFAENIPDRLAIPHLQTSCSRQSRKTNIEISASPIPAFSKIKNCAAPASENGDRGFRASNSNLEKKMRSAHPKGFALKIAYAAALIARVEHDLGYKLVHNKIDLLLDNEVASSVEQARAILDCIRYRRAK
jgi:hypothetical protein